MRSAMAVFQRRKKQSPSSYLVLYHVGQDPSASVPMTDRDGKIPIGEYFRGDHDDGLDRALRETMPMLFLGKVQLHSSFRAAESAVKYVADRNHIAEDGGWIIKLDISENRVRETLLTDSKLLLSTHMVEATEYLSLHYNELNPKKNPIRVVTASEALSDKPAR